jgi:hypothetical protein
MNNDDDLRIGMFISTSIIILIFLTFLAMNSCQNRTEQNLLNHVCGACLEQGATCKTYTCTFNKIWVQ